MQNENFIRMRCKIKPGMFFFSGVLRSDFYQGYNFGDTGFNIFRSGSRMARWWRKLRGSEDKAKEPAEASTSEEVFDSDMEIGDEDDFCESPTLVTVDDGKGGIKHIKVTNTILCYPL